MENYKDPYGDEVPGKGMVAYDGRHDDVEVIGFTSALQWRERLEAKLKKHQDAKEWYKNKIKGLNKQIRQVKAQIR